MAFAGNQQQNKTCIYRDMLAMLEEVSVHKDRNHWTLMRRSDVLAENLMNSKSEQNVSLRCTNEAQS
eukprot:4942042-Ditylum_brightwellii.AAC.1